MSAETRNQLLAAHAGKFRQKQKVPSEDFDISKNDELADFCGDLYLIFLDLRSQTTSGPNGPSPIKISDMVQYRDNVDSNLCRFKFQLIRDSDKIFLDRFHKKQNKELEKIKAKQNKKS